MNTAFQIICGIAAFSFGGLGLLVFAAGVYGVMEPTATGRGILECWKIAAVLMAVSAAFAYIGGL